MPGIRKIALAAALTCAAAPALANNYGESLAWQFRTTADAVNQAAILDLIAKRRGGYYAAPVYTTTIDHQFNCSVSAQATGNSGGLSATANSPSTTGASSLATGNTSETDAAARGLAASTDQHNPGPITAGVEGSTSGYGAGSAQQSLNSSQTNGAAQTASVGASNACAFGVLN